MLDEYQRAAVEARKNTVVTAGAGSGKTTVLAERFLHLLTSGEARVDGILTLTFTRKAAAEMYERIHRLLLERAEEAPDPELRRRLQTAVEGFEEASISTLDSFCAQVLRGGSERFGVPGDFRLEQGAAEDPAREAALDFMLAENRDPALARYVGIFGFSRVLEELFIPFAEEELFLTTRLECGNTPQRLAAWLNEEAGREAETMAQLAERILEAEPESSWVKGLHERLENLPDLRRCVREERWRELDKALAAGELKKNGRVKKPHLVELNDTVLEWNEAFSRLRQLLAVPAWEEEYRGLYRLLDSFREAYLQRKRESGLLSFQDVMQAAITLLIEDRELREYYKRQFSHIMIDEFQDNNDLQRQLLYLLAEREDLSAEGCVPESGELAPEKLFFVGDEKQSIYRFRGADVEVFQRLKWEFDGGAAGETPANEDATADEETPANEEGAAVKAEAGNAAVKQGAPGEGGLRINYRSHEKLVDFFNTLFDGVMNDAEELREFEARYAPIEGRRREAEIAPRTALLYKPYRDELDPEYVDGNQAEAWHVCRTIRRMVAEEGLRVHDGSGGSRPCRYDDIAVLMRSTGNQIYYERFLRRLGVPYTVQGTRSLFLEAPVYDLYNLLQLLVYPQDRLAYASLLRSPLVHLSDLTLARLLSGEAAPFSHTGEEELFPDGEQRRRYTAALRMYEDLSRRARRGSVGELLRALWYEYGYRYAVLQNPDHHPYLEFYDTLSEYARLYEERGEGLVAFLDFLRENLGEFEKVEETGGVRGRSEGVQILSVHRSKGLEFPVVFLVDTGNTGRQGGSDRLYTRSSEFGPVITWGEDGTVRQNRFMRQAKEEAELRDRAELKRLFYVACTRAEDHLYICGYHHRNNRNDVDGGGRGAMLNMLLRGLGLQGKKEDLDTAALSEHIGHLMTVEEIPEVTGQQIIGGSSFTRHREPEEVIGEYIGAETVERSVRRRDFSAVDLSSAGEEAEERPDAGAETGAELPAFESDRYLRREEEVRAFGTLAHARIEEELTPDARPLLMPAALAEKPEQERAVLEEEAGRIAQTFLDSELGQRARSGSCECELPFLLRLSRGERREEEAYVRGQIDLVLEEAEEVTVCDFKTDRRRDPEVHAGQLAAYRRAAEELYGKPVRTLLCYLRSMDVVEVEAAELPPLPEE